ncbi:unnamed protein product [Euphydryas editha]|uniref:Uncharacterized protein n=1 Tax=Euphydryas editha TaxID=104508 RepID=A0AAU9V663_EUPED|nr:unnamed protein product [Euphydryas editha]
MEFHKRWALKGTLDKTKIMSNVHVVPTLISVTNSTLEVVTYIPPHRPNISLAINIPYSSDLAPSDFHLFWSLQNSLVNVNIKRVLTKLLAAYLDKKSTGIGFCHYPHTRWLNKCN